MHFRRDGIVLHLPRTRPKVHEGERRWRRQEGGGSEIGREEEGARAGAEARTECLREAGRRKEEKGGGEEKEEGGGGGEKGRRR